MFLLSCLNAQFSGGGADVVFGKVVVCQRKGFPQMGSALLGG